MGVGNILVLTQVTVFVLSFILSFFIIIPMSVNQRDFDGHCLLYGKGSWNLSSKGEMELSDVEWGPNSGCRFNAFVGVVIMLLSLFYIILGSCYLFRQTDSSWLEAFITTIVCVTVTIMLFVTAITVTIGLKEWCDLITDTQSQISSCELADFITFAKEIGPNIDSSDFYIDIKMVEFGSWTSFLCWIVLTVTSIVKIINFRQHETFMTSVNRERQKLLQKVGHTDYVA